MSDKWRLVLADGRTVVAPTPHPSGFETHPQPWTYDGDDYGLHRSAGRAVAGWAKQKEHDVREIVPPGQLTADERVTEERAACVKWLRSESERLRAEQDRYALVKSWTLSDSYKREALTYQAVAARIAAGEHIPTNEVKRDEA